MSVVFEDGGLRHFQHNTGEEWMWACPWVPSHKGPCPPNGWKAPPVDGTPLDYGHPWGTWTFDEFVREYNPPLWWAIFEWGIGDDLRLRQDLLYATLDRYFEVKEMAPQERIEMIKEFMEYNYLPDQWVEWINEYIAKVS
jgi:hypothetical protein